MTSYTDEALRAEAVRAIRERAKALRVRARCTGWAIHLPPYGSKESISATLVAYGERTDLPMPMRQGFTEYVAI